jgi:hypothetical protein
MRKARILSRIRIPNIDFVIPYPFQQAELTFSFPAKAKNSLFCATGPAALDGRLRVGDQLIEINGESTRNLTHADAIQLIKNGGRTVRLLVRRGKPPPHNLLGSAWFFFNLFGAIFLESAGEDSYVADP